MPKLRLLTAALTLTATVAVAHQGVSNPAVMARMNAMSAISANVKTLGTMAKGQVAFDRMAARAAAASIADHATRSIDLFEAPETDPKSEALPAIWDNYADFAAKSEDMVRVAQSLAGSIETLADVQAGMEPLGQTCAACHKLYRE
ncbi:cytochrome c [uncultured Tateyamaria sp.]|uniref:c-type cytochrome n=1 Tax=uncultured Tateyamaria sp. TaxID=455651 RepID=UPI0026345E48|nr:cytochrome c [uncultured Tateyamaria sp.]